MGFLHYFYAPMCQCICFGYLQEARAQLQVQTTLEDVARLDRA